MVHWEQIAADRVAYANRRDEMSTFTQDIDSAIKQYQHLVWAGERRALRVAEDEPRRAADAKLYV
jgi:hypothetical protein